MCHTVTVLNYFVYCTSGLFCSNSKIVARKYPWESSYYPAAPEIALRFNRTNRPETISPYKGHQILFSVEEQFFISHSNNDELMQILSKLGENYEYLTTIRLNLIPTIFFLSKSV